MKKVLPLLFLLASCAKAPAPYGPVPSESQLAWQKMEMNMFVHFGPNTFTSKEWGTGTESEDIFNPSSLDCGQWTSIAETAGFKGIIITAKHHDGFCLWPNPTSTHTTAQSIWKDGKGDVLAELSEACRKDNLKFGVYISPWDRHDPHYGTPDYNEVFVRTLENALSNYGPVFEQWFDGACGEGENGKRQVYDWRIFDSTVRDLQPDAIVFGGEYENCRWVGNEKGIAQNTCWSTVENRWVPVETDVSIRPSWFYQQAQDTLVKSVSDLLSIYYTSVGRNSVLLLNVPPNQKGLISTPDSLRLLEFRAALDSIFAVDYAAGAMITATDTRGMAYAAENMLTDDYDLYWAPSDSTLSATITLSFDAPRTFNRILLQEYIPLGQRVSAFHIEALSNSGQWREIARETTIGYKRIIPVETTNTTSLRIVIDSSLACPTINRIALLMDNIMR